MRTKKRKKASRYAGSQTHGRGAKERTRGSGNQGGKGWAGTGKRADQKKTLVIRLFGNNYFGKYKTLRRGTPPQKLKVINLSDIQFRALSLPTKEGMIDLEGYKILGEGELKQPLKIRASTASQSAIDKITSAKGTLTLLKKNVEENAEMKSEKKEDKRYNPSAKKAKSPAKKQ